MDNQRKGGQFGARFTDPCQKNASLFLALEYPFVDVSLFRYTVIYLQTKLSLDSTSQGIQMVSWRKVSPIED